MPMELTTPAAGRYPIHVVIQRDGRAYAVCTKARAFAMVTRVTGRGAWPLGHLPQYITVSSATGCSLADGCLHIRCPWNRATPGSLARRYRGPLTGWVEIVAFLRQGAAGPNAHGLMRALTDWLCRIHPHTARVFDGRRRRRVA